jgi:hypothetical protein
MEGNSLDKSNKKALIEQYKNRTVIGGIYCIKCNGNDNLWIRSTKDLKGSKNRFLFSLSINSCPEACMQKVWNQFGATAFSFEILEEIQKKETQTEHEFEDDIATLLEIWNEKLNS